MAELVELAEERVHEVDDVYALLFDDGGEVTDVAEQDGHVVLGLLQFVLAVFYLFVDEFGHEQGEDVLAVVGLVFERLLV
jgi:GGDEF domain-containing protein